MSDADQYIDRIHKLHEIAMLPMDATARLKLLADALLQAAGAMEANGWPETAALMRDIAQSGDS